MADWTSDLSSFTRALRSRVRGAARHLARSVSGSSPYEIVPYRGHGSADRLYVHGRVLESEDIAPAAEADSTWRNLLNTWKRLESDPLPHARVMARRGSVEQEIVADDEGFFGAWMPSGSAMAGDALWQTVELELLGPLRSHDSN